MELIYSLIDFIMHIDKHIDILMQQYDTWIYGILGLIVFCETGLVVIPFLPGDSLLFAVGALSATGTMNVYVIALILMFAALLGDTVNYHFGKFIGPKVFHKENVKFLNKEYLNRTHAFYEKHGGKTVIIARFIPIIRTFSPFVAGMGAMSFKKFFSFSIIGTALWVLTFVGVGYRFGNLPIVKDNFTYVIFAIILISVIPVFIGWAKQKLSK